MSGCARLGFNLPSWTDDGWFFNPFTWQLLFMIGAILAYSPPRRLPAPPRLLDVALGLIAGGLVVIIRGLAAPGLRRVLPWRVATRCCRSTRRPRPAAADLHPGAALADGAPGSGGCALASLAAGWPAGADGAAFVAGVLLQHLHRLLWADGAGMARRGTHAIAGQWRRFRRDGRGRRNRGLVWRTRPGPPRGARRRAGIRHGAPARAAAGPGAGVRRCAPGGGGGRPLSAGRGPGRRPRTARCLRARGACGRAG